MGDEGVAASIAAALSPEMADVVAGMASTISLACGAVAACAVSDPTGAVPGGTAAVDLRACGAAATTGGVSRATLSAFAAGTRDREDDRLFCCAVLSPCPQPDSASRASTTQGKVTEAVLERGIAAARCARTPTMSRAPASTSCAKHPITANCERDGREKCRLGALFGVRHTACSPTTHDEAFCCTDQRYRPAHRARSGNRPVTAALQRRTHGRKPLCKTISKIPSGAPLAPAPS